MTITRVMSQNEHTKTLFGGVFASDNLPLYCFGSTFYIVNTDVHTGEGIHWVVVFVESCDKPFYWFDSLGKLPNFYNNFLFNFVTKNGTSSYIANRVQIQSPYSNKCGYFCLMISDCICKGVEINHIFDLFFHDDLEKNDLIVMAYFNKFLHI